MSLISEYDEFGFKRSAEEIKYLSEDSDFFSKIVKRQLQWKNFEASAYRNNFLFRDYTLKRYIRKGIPNSLRKKIWLRTSGCEKLMEQHPSLYSDLFKNEQNFDRQISESIKIDLNRTFPDNLFFAKYKVSLFNVLNCYSIHNPVIGYCQGLNYIAGLLLVVTGEEEATFWLLKYLVENVAVEYHTKTMKGLKRDIDVITELIKIRLPLVNEKVNELGLPWIVIMTKWLICVYAEVLPVETTLRVWDTIFNEGYKIVFRASLAIVITLKDEIMQIQDINDLAELFRNISKDQRFLNCHKFMQSMFSINLKKKEILTLRRNCAAKNN